MSPHTFPPQICETVAALEKATHKETAAGTSGKLAPIKGNDVPANLKGKLAPIAIRVLMTVLWAARLARFDLLRAVCALAQNVSKWTTECDRRLARLMGYIAYSKGMRTLDGYGMI